jgi:hypothetical protein
MKINDYPNGLHRTDRGNALSIKCGEGIFSLLLTANRKARIAPSLRYIPQGWPRPHFAVSDAIRTPVSNSGANHSLGAYFRKVIVDINEDEEIKLVYEEGEQKAEAISDARRGAVLPEPCPTLYRSKQAKKSRRPKGRSKLLKERKK